MAEWSRASGKAHGGWEKTLPFRASEIAALRRGVELGLTLIDTAEMYGDGGAERLLGEALRGIRDRVFLVSKVYPQNAGGAALRRACENSLRRLATDRIDLYLLHWRGAVPLKTTIEGMQSLQREGKIAAWGVSNFDVDDMVELRAAGGTDCATNQILYNLLRRGPEFDLMPEMARRKVPVMAYSPIEQGRLPKSGALAAVAKRHQATIFQIALAWVLRRPDVVAIPKAATIGHVEAQPSGPRHRTRCRGIGRARRGFPAAGRKSAPGDAISRRNGVANAR
jgi:diketogulonate reductase-like aldo/keto reductase